MCFPSPKRENDESYGKNDENDQKTKGNMEDYGKMGETLRTILGKVWENDEHYQKTIKQLLEEH